jgi:hypothetical protein
MRLLQVDACALIRLISVRSLLSVLQHDFGAARFGSLIL